MKIKFEDFPQYEETEVIAKTSDREDYGCFPVVAGTVYREEIKRRAILTEADGFTGDKRVVDGDGTPILSVKKVETPIPLFVELVGGVKSADGAIDPAAHCWTAPDADNAGVIDIFSTNRAWAANIVACAASMCAAHPEANGKWKLVTADGTRVFIRAVSTDISANGFIGR